MIHRSSLARHRAPRVPMEYELEIHGVTRKVELPFVAGVMADLSGRPAEPPEPVSDRAFVEIDSGNFDARMAAMRPRVAFAVPNTLTGLGDLLVDITFGCIAHFSPAAVARQVAPLHKLLEARQQLADAGHSPKVEADAGDSGPAVVETIAEIDRRLGQQLNLILHVDDFQRLESAWRGLHYLVSHTETDELLKIRVLNISKNELGRTLKKFKGVAWDQSPIFNKIYRDGYGSSGGTPFGCLVGDYAFDHSPLDVEILSEIAKICAAAHVPFLAAASPGVMEMESWQELPTPRDLSKIFMTAECDSWRALRDSEDARYLGLMLPRFLARQPYGLGTRPVQEFAFEEDTGDLDHTKFVWANSAYAMAVNIHRSFKIHGWCSRICGLESGGAVEGLPVVTHAAGNGGVEMLCPTEVDISDRREADLARNGFIALVHRKASDIAAFFSANSLCKPAEYDDPDATTNARMATRLPYLFAACRFAHCVKAIGRDKFATMKDRDSLQEWLDAWIANYVDSDPATPTAFAQSPRPFAAAEVVVEQLPDQSEGFTTKFYLRPND